MAMKDSLGVGVIGAGFMGETYACAVSTQVEHAHLVAVTGGSRGPALAEKYGAAAEDSVDTLVARDDVDVVCIATPHACHGPEGVAAAMAGKHLLIDKPMATTLEDCDAILAACEDNQLRCELMYTQRNRICNRSMKALLDSGELGRVLHMHNMQVVPDGMKTTPKWQLQAENVGILLGHGIHNLDQPRWLLNQDIAKVFGKVSCADPACAVDGTSSLTLTMEDGTICTVFCSFEVPAPGIPRSGGATQVVCERGLIDCDWYGDLRVSRDGGPWKVVATQPTIDWAGKGFLDPVRLETYAGVLQRVVDDARAGKPAGGTGWDGRQAVAAALAAYESSRSGEEINLRLCSHGL